MGKEEHFVYAPSTVDIRRSKFLINNRLKMPVYHGDLVPLEITDILPGDSVKVDLSVFVRTATPPIAPFMDGVRFNIAAFAVPKRLVWPKEKEFLGENTEGYGIQTEILAPRDNGGHCDVSATDAVTRYPRSLATNLGLVYFNPGTISAHAPIALNPIRAFLQVYNDWFRNENFMAPYLWDHTQTGDGDRYIATLNGLNISGIDDLPKVCKQLDRFTSCLPWAQKGNPVLIGMTGYAPFALLSGASDYNVKRLDGTTTSTPVIFGQSGVGYDTDKVGLLAQSAARELYVPLSSDTTDQRAKSDFVMAKNSNMYTNIVADLSRATATSINEFRLAFATQRYLEQLARSGSKYREYIKGMFGVSIADKTAQMAEYLGGMTIELNVDQILQTTDYAAGSTTKLGAPGASSTSAANSYLFTKSFDEPSYLVIVGYFKHNRTYGQGIDEIYRKHELLEDYNPKFANIGETAIHKWTLFYTGNAALDDLRFGFQEAWSEYRHKRDEVRGALNPAIDSSLNFWTLADNYASSPDLNAGFLTENRTSIARALAGGESSPDYFIDIKFKRTFVRPMPLYSIPGLIDHH